MPTFRSCRNISTGAFDLQRSAGESSFHVRGPLPMNLLTMS